MDTNDRQRCLRDAKSGDDVLAHAPRLVGSWFRCPGVEARQRGGRMSRQDPDVLAGEGVGPLDKQRLVGGVEMGGQPQQGLLVFDLL